MSNFGKSEGSDPHNLRGFGSSKGDPGDTCERRRNDCSNCQQYYFFSKTDKLDRFWEFFRERFNPKKAKNGLSSYPKNRKKYLKSDFFQIRWPLPISTLFSLDIPVHTGPGGAEGTSEPGQLCRLGLRLAAATWPYSILFLARLQKKLVLIL